jgi:hypothetical protein
VGGEVAEMESGWEKENQKLREGGRLVLVEIGLGFSCVSRLFFLLKLPLLCVLEIYIYRYDLYYYYYYYYYFVNFDFF